MTVSARSASKTRTERERERESSKCPGVRVVGTRIYDPQNGKTCHQCRQKTMDFSASCKNQKQDKQCPIKFCHKCLLNRYGEKAEKVALFDDWRCPKCRGICNCSFCMKKRGHKPTGILVHTAKATGFSSVSEMLQVKGPDDVCHPNTVKDVGASPKKSVSSKKELVVASRRKLGKENSFDANCDSRSSLSNVTPISNAKKSKKTKREELKETRNGNRDNANILKQSSLKKARVYKEISGEEVKRKGIAETDLAEEKNNSLNHVKRRGIDGAKSENKVPANSAKLSAEISRKDKNQGSNEISKEKMKKSGKDDAKFEKGVSDDVKHADAEAKLRAAGKPCEVKKWTTEVKYKELDAEIQLPLCTSPVTVARIEIPPEHVGNALQFLEFSAAFGEVLGMKKGQPESVIREFIRGRSRLRQQHSSIVEVHIQLLSLIQKDKGGRSGSFSPAAGKNSWLKALEKCISESQCQLKEFPSDWFSKGIEGYDQLDTSKKLQLLNFLCDEALCTNALRNWIEDQNSKFAEEEKEAKEMVNAARDKEKQLKQQLQDELAIAIIANNGAPLTISDHDAIVSKIKSKAAEAHAEMLEAMDMVPKRRQRSDAVRTEPILLENNGHAFWRLKSYTGEPNILLQDMGGWDVDAPNEKWFAYAAEQKQEIEKYISCLRGKRLRAQKSLKHLQ